MNKNFNQYVTKKNEINGENFKKYSKHINSVPEQYFKGKEYKKMIFITYIYGKFD
jgi:hypothetical protein